MPSIAGNALTGAEASSPIADSSSARANRSSILAARFPAAGMATGVAAAAEADVAGYGASVVPSLTVSRTARDTILVYTTAT
jgi:hypothetical protein